MSVSLTSKFFANARGLTLLDGGGITWSINKNTNAVTATGSGGGVLSSVGFADTSSTPIYTVTNSPLTANGTLDITLKTQAANLVFAGPGTGAAAQPTFRGLVLADIPTGYAYGNLSGAPSIPVGANPTAKVALAAVNGSAATFMRSDGAPALDVTISPTWTGNHVFNPASGNAIGVTTSATGNGAAVSATNATGYGVNVTGTAGGARNLALFGEAGFSNGFTVAYDGTQMQYAFRNGNIVASAPASGDLLALTNVAGGNALVVNGNSAGTAVVRLNTQATTGAQTATFSATNKPGTGTTAPTKWIPINIDGTTMYVPAWL